MGGEAEEPCAAGSSRVRKLIEEFQSANNDSCSDRVINRLGVTKVDMPAHQIGDSIASNDSGGSWWGKFSENRIMYENISPSNRFWLRIYTILSLLGVAFLVIAYSFYIIGLFEPILYLDAGEFTDTDLFQPFYETLPHSLITLYKQKAYFTVIIAGLFSLLLPFMKMIVTSVAFVTAWNHRRTQLRLFFGEKPIDKSGIRNEDDGNIKYAREMLIILKLVSKFQMVDVVILLLNAVFLRCAFLWARPGRGLLFLIIYCLLSIAGAQMVNFSVEGEKDIFDAWYTIKYAIVPREFSINSISSADNNGTDSQNDIVTPQKKRWFISEDFICLMAGLNILSCVSLMTNEKLLTVNFTMDTKKILAMDSTSMSYSEIIQSVSAMQFGHIAVIILFFLCIVFPMVFSLLFLASIFGYNYCKRKNTEPLKRVKISNPEDDEPNLDYDWDVKYTCFVFKLCNIVSEWSCGEVLSLATMAAYTSMTTADRVIVTIPPKNTASALFMLAAYGISSFLLMAMFYIWNQNVKNEFSQIHIYVKYLEESNNSTMTRIIPANQFTDDSQPMDLQKLGNCRLRYPDPLRPKPPRRMFVVPYLEGIRGVLYSKWLSTLFFGLLTAFTIFFTMSAYTYSYPTPQVNPMAVNNFLANELHEIYGLAQKQIPQSIGECGYERQPPELPCSGTKPLYEMHQMCYAGFIWMGGLRSVSLERANYFLTADNRMAFRIKFHAKELKAYLRFAAVENNRLYNVIEDIIRTSEDGFTVEMDISMQCTNRRPQIRDLRVDNTTVTNFSTNFLLYRILKAVIDFDKALGKLATNQINELLRDRRQRIMWRGVSFDVMEMINLIVVKNWPANFVCPTTEL
ncbi:hypothetical protein X943_002331 [Babesia divergens]|uniref:Uncharacterized protein n=1 Tax=Babesia divergens TaxID=32595 RepID=A0AAD9LH38_BABDI|nr:hypothetical protein X943_002331 [Babesia divergens]